MDEDEVLHRFGTPLPVLDEDDVPAKKPIYAEDQIVTDENGRRRFHGAFTGGFSAGFWNTVGSLHGWVPQMYKSSRSERAGQSKQQRPEDFMDDEDLGEFGIAPQRIQASDDFAKERKKEGAGKRKFLQEAAGPIPGQPVLAMLLKPVRDKAAVRILKSMGWRPGQGVGPRQTRKQKKAANARNKRELYIWQRYCDDDDEAMTMKKPEVVSDEIAGNSDGDDDDEDEDDEEDDDQITFAPSDIEPLFLKSKTHTFGFGYTGLTGTSSSVALTQEPSTQLQRFELFEPLQVLGKNNKKLSIAGQAFGVGALEEEDEDIYARDDMTKYDFSLGDKQKKAKESKEQQVQDRNVIAGFVEDTSPPILKPPYLVDIPRDYKPRNWAQRKSRFEPLHEERQRELQQELKQHSVGRHNLNADRRGQLLGEEPVLVKETPKPVPVSDKRQELRAERTKELLERISAKSSNFTKGGLITSDGQEQALDAVSTTAEEEKERSELLERATSKTKSLGKPTEKFQPFLGNDLKQERYEKFLETKLVKEEEVAEFLQKHQPVNMSEWDRAMEVKEFLQARNIYKPLGGIMSDRFVSEAKLSAEEAVKAAEAEAKAPEKVIKMERSKKMWKPAALLCKRYNIAEPFGGTMPEDEQKLLPKPKISVFDYLEMSINKKENFQTPVIIPKHIEKPKVLVKESETKAPPTPTPMTESAEPPPPGTEPETVKPNAPPIDAKTVKYTPKTELEKDVEANKDKPLWEKTALYKAIFDDSDEEEENKAEETTTSVNKELLEKLVEPPKTLTAAASNLLRNASPPRGIFAALFTTPKPEEKAEPEPTVINKKSTVSSPEESKEPAKIVFQSRKQRMQADEEPSSTSTATYGPSLPKSITEKPSTSNSSSKTDEQELTLRIEQLLEKHKNTVWVERTAKDGTSDEDGSSSSDTEYTSTSSESDSARKSAKKKRSKHKKVEHKKVDRKKHKKKDSKSKQKKKHDKKHKIKKKKKK